MQTITRPVPLSCSTSGCVRTGTRVPNSGVSASPPDQVAVALVVGVGEQRHARRDQLRARRLDQRLAGSAVGRRARSGRGASRPGARGPRARPGRRPSGSRRPTASAPPAGRPRRARAGRGRSAGRSAARACRSSCRSSTSRPTGPSARHSASKACSSLSVSCRQSSTKFGREIDIGSFSEGSVGGDEVRVVGDRRVAAHAEVVLHATLGRQAVVVPAHRVEDLPAAHPPVARHGVGVRVGEDVPDVQRAAHRRRRRVDREDALARGRAVEAIGAVALPGRAPLLLEAVQRRALGDARAALCGCSVRTSR